MSVILFGKCSICKEPINFNHVVIKCRYCDQVFHGICVGLNKDDLCTILKNNKVWACSTCNIDYWKMIRSSGERSYTPISQTTFADDEYEDDDDDDYLSYGDLTGDEPTSRGMSNLLKSLVIENVSLKSQLSELKYRVMKTENKLRINIVEILGIPCYKEENLIEYVRKISQYIEFSFHDMMILSCFRSQIRQSSERYTSIIIQFSRTKFKEEFMKKANQRGGGSVPLRKTGFGGLRKGLVFIVDASWKYGEINPGSFFQHNNKRELYFDHPDLFAPIGKA